MNEAAKQQGAKDRRAKKMRTALWVVITIAILLSIFLFIENMPPAEGKYDALAKCIANTSTTFYGAFWCPHCVRQKNEFGSAQKYLPYVECSLPDQSGQTQVCIDKKISSYPTWVFPDGTSQTGEVSLSDLSKKTGCPLPTST